MGGAEDDSGTDEDLESLQDLLGPRSRPKTPGLRGVALPQGRPGPAGQGDGARRDVGPDDAEAGADDENALGGEGDGPAPAGADGAKPTHAERGESRGDAGEPHKTEATDAEGRADVGEEAPQVHGAATHVPRRTDRSRPTRRSSGDGTHDVIEAEPLPATHIAALSPLDPGIGLAGRLRKDRLLNVPVRPWPRIAAVALAGVFLLLWLFALRAAAVGRPWPSAGLPASGWLLGLALGAVGAYFVMQRLWPARELRLPLADTQQEQLRRVEELARSMRFMIAAGVAGAAAGVFVLAVGFAAVPMSQWAGVLGFGSLLLAAGVVTAVVGVARWLPTRMLYVQTLVLERLEAMGLGRQLAMDPRTADVLVSLDRLLGDLPESSVRQFLSKPEAEWYLELLGELKGGRGGG